MIERVGLDRWRQFDAAHPAPTFFARPAWAISLAEIYPGLTPVLLHIEPRDGAPVLLPALEQTGSLGLRHFAGFPLGGYTCFLREDGSVASAQQATAVLRDLAQFAHSLEIVPWPLAPAPQCDAQITHHTAVVDLRDGIDCALARVGGTFRRMAGQAQRRGVVCAPVSGDDAVETYYALLCESAKRWGIPEPVERRVLIEALVRYGGTDVEIWFARADGRAIAGGVVFYGAEEFFFWSAAMLAEFGRLRPSNALNFALLHAAAKRGMSWYNLGSSDGLPGVAHFKKDLGARDVSYAQIELAQTPVRVARALRDAVIRRMTG
ncbi:MAG TPA: GNAT family N-acetyltransferase [Candidatus Baltobacteraceae bacterium]|nr:GNAT family N-acetyltransferase [Candidatus Baltobacteraceae bacterium]